MQNTDYFYMFQNPNQKMLQFYYVDLPDNFDGVANNVHNVLVQQNDVEMVTYLL